MGGLFKSGKSAAKRQANLMAKQLEEDRRQFELEQARLAEERAAAEKRMQEQQLQQAARDNASKLQAQLAEENRLREVDSVADITTDVEMSTGSDRKKRKPLELSSVLGI